MNVAMDVENKLEQTLKKLKMTHAIKSFKLKINWGHKEDVAKEYQNLSEIKDALNKCLFKILSRPRRAEIRNVISELVKKKNDMDSLSEISNDSVNSSNFDSEVMNNSKKVSNAHLKQFLCEYCGKQFLQMSTWKYHLLNVHDQNKKIKQAIRNKDETKFPCEICAKCFSSLKILESHKSTHKAHECVGCFQKFETKAKLNSHVKSVHEMKLKCRYCHLPFKCKIQLRNHVLDEHKRPKVKDRPSPKSEFVCPYLNCGKTFKYSRSLRNHVASTHESGKEALSCDVCRKSFFDKGKLNRHLTSHQAGKFECNVCSKTFSRMDALKRHVVVSHEEAKSFTCKFCDKTFSLKYNRDTHQENVHGNCNTSFECEICGRKCKNKTTFAIHKKTHSERKFSCGFCAKAFNRKANYQSHMKKKHPGISPFQTLLNSVAEV